MGDLYLHMRESSLLFLISSCTCAFARFDRENQIQYNKIKETRVQTMEIPLIG